MADVVIPRHSTQPGDAMLGFLQALIRYISCCAWTGRYRISATDMASVRGAVTYTGRYLMSDKSAKRHHAKLLDSTTSVFGLFTSYAVSLLYVKRADNGLVRNHYLVTLFHHANGCKPIAKSEAERIVIERVQSLWDVELNGPYLDWELMLTTTATNVVVPKGRGL